MDSLSPLPEKSPKEGRRHPGPGSEPCASGALTPVRPGPAPPASREMSPELRGPRGLTCHGLLGSDLAKAAAGPKQSLDHSAWP